MLYTGDIYSPSHFDIMLHSMDTADRSELMSTLKLESQQFINHAHTNAETSLWTKNIDTQVSVMQNLRNSLNDCEYPYVKFDDNDIAKLDHQMHAKAHSDLINNMLSKPVEIRQNLFLRLRDECLYYIGNGNGSDKYLWSGNAETQINDMLKLWDSFALNEQPYQITKDGIYTLGNRMQNVQEKRIGTANQIKDLTSPLNENISLEFYTDNGQQYVYISGEDATGCKYKVDNFDEVGGLVNDYVSNMKEREVDNEEGEEKE